MADFGAVLIRVSLALSAAVLLIMLLRLPIRKVGGPRIAYGLWALVPLAVLSAFVPAPISLGLFRPIALERPVMAAVSAVRTMANLVPAENLAATTSASPVSLAPWLLLWLAGASILLLRLLWLETRLARNLTGLRADPVQRDVYYMDGEDLGPMVVGLWKARIILPANFPSRYEGEERELILAHERAHVRAGHLVTGGLGYLLLILQWFNPLAHVAVRMFRIDQELACDAAVVARYPDKRAAYARAMFKTGLAGLSGVSAPLACGWSSNPVRRRIAALRGESPGRARRTVAAMLTVGAVVAGSATTYAAMAAPVTNRVAAVIERSELAPVLARGSGVDGQAVKAGSKIRLAARSAAPAQASQINARHELLTEQYLQAYPADRVTGINPANLENYVGKAEYQQMLESGRSTETASDALSVPSARNSGVFSFVVPAGMNRDDAARAVGLADASGYGADRAAPRGQTVMVLCRTAQTPASVACF